MDIGSVNWLAVGVCVVAGFAAGFICFGKTGNGGMDRTWRMTTGASIVQAVIDG